MIKFVQSRQRIASTFVKARQGNDDGAGVKPQMTSFSSITFEQLESSTAAELDTLAFGVIGFNADCLVDRYNRTESVYAGLSPESVTGRHLFDEVAMCMNNFMVAQRYYDEPTLDQEIDYVLTLRMRPTKVKMRMLKSASRDRRYLLIHRV